MSSRSTNWWEETTSFFSFIIIFVIIAFILPLCLLPGLWVTRVISNTPRRRLQHPCSCMYTLWFYSYGKVQYICIDSGNWTQGTQAVFIKETFLEWRVIRAGASSSLMDVVFALRGDTGSVCHWLQFRHDKGRTEVLHPSRLYSVTPLPGVVTFVCGKWMQLVLHVAFWGFLTSVFNHLLSFFLFDIRGFLIEWKNP